MLRGASLVGAAVMTGPQADQGRPGNDASPVIPVAAAARRRSRSNVRFRFAR
jgi:hypothetical protein